MGFSRYNFAMIRVCTMIAVLNCAITYAENERPNVAPPEFVALFNGKDLAGWKGLVGNPKTRPTMNPDELATKQKTADESMRTHWKAVDGVLVFDGRGQNICTAAQYGDFELLIDWKIEKNGDSGIYLHGSPQVQICDPDDPKCLKTGGDKGSGGLWNNQKHPRLALVLADKPIGEWNTFRIRMIGEKVTVHLNGQVVTDNVTMENYWEKGKPIYLREQLELQAFGSPVSFRNIFIRELPADPK